MKRTDWPKSAVRIVFGIIWLVDAIFKWQPAFRDGYLGFLQDASKGQPDWLSGWFNFWINLVSPRVGFFAYTTAVIETLIALALIVGLGRKLTYIAAAAFSLLIWSTAEGFGGPYTAGSTDVGAALIYAVVFLSLLALNWQGGVSRLSVDYLIEKRFPWWAKIAEVRPLPSQPEVKPMTVEAGASLGRTGTYAH